MKTSYKLNSDLIKRLPKPVQTKVNGLKQQYRTRSVSYTVETEGVFLDEDSDYSFFNLKGEKLSFRMDGEWSGYSSHPVKSAIGKRAPLPVGCFAVEFELFLGHPFIRVYHNPSEALPQLTGGAQ